VHCSISPLSVTNLLGGDILFHEILKEGHLVSNLLFPELVLVLSIQSSLHNQAFFVKVEDNAAASVSTTPP
jgi:hypothetical protein